MKKEQKGMDDKELAEDIDCTFKQDVFQLIQINKAPLLQFRP